MERYLKGASDKGLTMKPKQVLQIFFVDADFAGLWNYEDIQDPISVKSLSGFLFL